MKNTILISLVLLSLNAVAQTSSEKLIASCCSTEEGRRCTGSAYCTACTNCSGCKHCSGGGSCGVCDRGNRSKKTSSTSKSSTSESTYAVKLKKISFRSFHRGESLFVANTTLNLRNGPGTNYKIIAKLKLNEELIFIEQAGDWIKVKVKKSGVEGWAYGEYVY